MTFRSLFERLPDWILWRPVTVGVVLAFTMLVVWWGLRWYVGYIARHSLGRTNRTIRQAVRDAVLGTARADAEWTSQINTRLRVAESQLTDMMDDIQLIHERTHTNTIQEEAPAQARPRARAREAVAPKKGRGRKAPERQEAPTQWDRISQDEEPDDGSGQAG